jgi:hypothetical protein
MAQEIILFVQGIELPPDVLDLAHSLLSQGFTLRMVPPRTRSGAIGEAIREVDYALGFIFHLPDEAYLDAHRLKLVQVLSAGYDMHAIMLMLAVYRKLVRFHQNVVGGRRYQSLDATSKAEEWWVQEVVEQRGMTSFNQECTPGYYNFEGEFQRRQDGNSNGTFFQYCNHLNEVRARMDAHFTFTNRPLTSE